MAKLIINWWKQLNWIVKPVWNKNSIIKIIPACLLTDETVTIKNVPQSSDVLNMCEILQKLWW
jgi:UDP-N-acetylglucosamine enolpyruvyl transferase